MTPIHICYAIWLVLIFALALRGWIFSAILTVIIGFIIMVSYAKLEDHWYDHNWDVDIKFNTVQTNR